MSACISFQDVAIDRGSGVIWSEGSFDIQQGEVTAIIGSNGSGKTTLIELILGLLYPSSGKVEVQENLQLGYVPQNYQIRTPMVIRARDIVQMGANGEKVGLGMSNTKELVNLALEKVGASDFATKRFGELSGGQKQRIMIATALVQEVQILILDEPLSALDIKSAREIVQLIKELNAKNGMTTLVVAHDLGLLLPVLSSVIYLVDGHAHYQKLDDGDHKDFGDLLEHLKTLRVGDHDL
ncbi:MAG: ATP-binding cassette domain-containing protein [Candidatus Ancillula sp.]|nr:ATP-binding cassette domain-containing protein [Candidatus Ancillula sp.]